MAIPVRLTVGNSANHRAINLEATGFNLAIERNISAFALPFNNAFKAGIDPNMALTSINIQGVLTDDQVATSPAVSASMRIDFSSLYPTSKARVDCRDSGVIRDMILTNKFVLSLTDVNASHTSAFNTAGIAKPSDVFPTGTVAHSQKGEVIGTITNSTHAFGGLGALTIGGGTAVALETNDFIFPESPASFLDDKGFTLMPRYWTISGNEPDPSRPNTGIAFRFDASAKPSVAGGSATPTFVPGSQPEYGNIPTITIPIQDVFKNPSDGNPAKSLAAIVKTAIENTDNLTTKQTTAAGGQSSNDTFSVYYGDTAQTVLIIVQKDTGHMIYSPDVFSTGWRGSGTTQGVSGWAYEVKPQHDMSSGHREMSPTLPLHSLFQGGGDEMLSKSAGDKTQDLIGIFANSPVGDADDIVGIQIPYDTLVTSNSVSTEVRNFFLTFGKTITKDMKSSDGNTRPASQPIDLIERRADSPSNVTGQSSSSLINAVTTIFEGVANVIDSIWVTYDTKTSGNRGGMLIIPAKLAIHQEAGQPYYTFDMRLHAAQHKIAP